ncbi:MAG: hypothetical protein CBB68_03705 [Rhodospirillaceae bacterium TMED8]|nr:2-methylcitrate dehydratase [Magnetovibrio sp.]OUT51987.1 MAG: hypothetical protein CBB68_03705 [Rhodospirillaceae bacterium TMED8]|tara:strand:- start:380 stop:1753 length:1374 start_codon:yes stop_codon:yes gene_type:complete
MNTVAKRIAQHIHNLNWRDVPDNAIYWAKIGILDTIGVTLAASNEPCVRLAGSLPGTGDSFGRAFIYGRGTRTSVMDAAFVNGVASHALDFDDVNNHIGGHPSVPLVPAIFALGDDLGVSGRDALLAYIAGFETETRIGLGVNQHHYEKGWHPTATLGIFGTVAAASRLLGLDAEKTATALGIAVSLASGVKANFGTMTKPLHVGQSVRNGLMAAYLAREGFTSNLEAFEHHQGFLEVFNGEGLHDITRTFAEWGNPWNVTNPGPNIKQYPCCGSTHGAINAIIRLRTEYRLCPEDVERIEVLTTPRRLPHTNNPDPQNGLEAKFSLHYVTARALIDGTVRLADFNEGAEKDVAARSLMSKITVGIHPDMSNPDQDGYGAEVIVRTTGGRDLRARVDHDVLRGPEYPMSDAELYDKFKDCVWSTVGANNIRSLYDLLSKLEKMSNISRLSDYIERFK